MNVPSTPPNPPEPPAHSAYLRAAQEADDDIRDALEAVTLELAAGRITAEEADAEKLGLLQRHLQICRDLRVRHLGGTP